jgi:hypothetical protein
MSFLKVRFGILIIAAALCYFPAQAQQLCSELFVNDSTIPEELMDNNVFPLFRKAFELQPQLLATLTDVLLAQARHHLIRDNTSFREIEEYDTITQQTYKVLVINPGLTKLGKFAEFIQKKYGATVVFNPAKLIQFNGAAAVTFATLLSNGSISNSLFFINSDHIIGGPSFRYLRDISVLHELKHLNIFQQMINRNPLPFYGEVQIIKGVLPQDPAPDYRPYARYLSLSELKTYHTQIKGQITQLRGAIRRNQSAAEQNLHLAQLKQVTEMLGIVSARISYFVNLLADPQHLSFAISREAFDILTVVITYENEGNTILYTLPLVGVTNASDIFLVRELYAVQVKWLQETALITNQQTLQVWKLLVEFTNTQDITRRLALLDEMQRAMNPTALLQAPTNPF